MQAGPTSMAASPTWVGPPPLPDPTLVDLPPAAQPSPVSLTVHPGERGDPSGAGTPRLEGDHDQLGSLSSTPHSPPVSHLFTDDPYMSSAFDRRGLPEDDPYPHVQIDDAGVLTQTRWDSGDLRFPDLTRRIDEQWSVQSGGPRLTAESCDQPIGAYHTVLPPSPRRLGRGFNPTITKFRRMWSPLLRGERRDKSCPACGYDCSHYGKCRNCGRLFWCTWCDSDTDGQGRCLTNPECVHHGEPNVHEVHVVCHRCGRPGVRDGLCTNSGCRISVICPGCQERTDKSGACCTTSCTEYGHRLDDPRCTDCHEFVDEGEVLCVTCKQKWPYAPSP